MNTIKNYLESMFANMPNTPEVLKAKNELWQMMEDKYNELMAAGASENEAVGTVISEFGNLEELADSLGLKSAFEQKNANTTEVPRRQISMEDARAYIQDRTAGGLMTGIATFLCITSVCWPILFDGSRYLEMTGILCMFASIAVAIVLFVMSGSRQNCWDYIKKEPCALDYATATEISAEREKYRSTNAVRLTIGILLCALCWIPAMIFEELGVGSFVITERAIPTALFVTVGIGVLLIILTKKIMNSYDNLLETNDRTTVSGSYGSEGQPVYINSTVQTIMEVYWPTITCIYLAYSFLTFNWFSSWIIWPIAGIIHHVLKKNLSK